MGEENARAFSKSDKEINDSFFEIYLSKLVEISGSIKNANFYTSDVFLGNRNVAKQIFDLTTEEVNLLLNVVKGIAPVTAIDNAQMTAMCFPTKFLKLDSILELSSDKLKPLNDIINLTFYLGFMYHLIFIDFPSRKNILGQLDTKSFFEKYYPQTLMANDILKDYKSENEELADYIFYVYFFEIEDFLQKELGIRFFKRNICRSFLENLYLSGALLGKQLDMSIRY